MIAQISDPHIGREPIADEQLERAVAAILALPQAPDAVLVSGDLTDHGTADELARVTAALKPLPMPVHVLAGNHDDRATLRAAFGLPGDPVGPIAYATTICGLRLVAADTTVPGQDAGRIDVEAIAAALDADRDTPTLLALHHAPVPTGIPIMDTLMPPADQRAALAAVLERSPQVRRVVCGHVHRTAVTQLGGRDVLTLGSTNVALALDLEATEFAMVTQPQLLALHVLVDGELVTHLQPI